MQLKTVAQLGGTVLLLSAALVASCASAPPHSVDAEGLKSDQRAATDLKESSSDADTAEAADGQETGPEVQEKKQGAGGDQPQDAASEEGPTACPEEMILVEGEYCTASDNDAKADENGNTPGGGASDVKIIERECIKEWYAPQNKKRVCEEFAKEGSCTGKMVKKRFCVDKYAWPNKKGHKPEVMNRFYQAQVKCAAVDKRLCTESEWTFSCEGPDMKPFPYGYTRDAKKCHGDEEWDSPNMMKVAQRDKKELRRLYKGKPSGQEECVSDFGVYDLPGNTDEIVASETFEKGWRGKYESTHTGGPWYKGVRNQCRPKIYTHDEGFYYYFLSFRCCSDAGEGKTDPLTPHQKAKGWDMKRVERIAGISVEKMREMLKKKETDPTCGCKSTKCRTFCGTLHGDDWNEAAEKADQEKAKKDVAQKTEN